LSICGCTWVFNYDQCSVDDDCQGMYGQEQPYCTTDRLCVKDPPPARLCGEQYPQNLQPNMQNPAMGAIPLGAMMNLTADADGLTDQPYVQVLQMAVDELNTQSQFIRSLRPIVVYMCDTARARSATDLVNMLKYLASERKVAGVIGPTTPERVSEVVSAAASLQVPIISPTVTSAAIGKLNGQGFSFRTAPVENRQMVLLGGQDGVPSSTSGKVVNLTVVSVQNDYGEALRQSFQDEWSKKSPDNVPRSTKTYPGAISDKARMEVEATAEAILGEAPPTDILLIANQRVHPHTLTLLRRLKELKTYDPMQQLLPTRFWITDGGRGTDLVELASDPAFPQALFDNLVGVAPLSFDREQMMGQATLFTQTVIDFRNNYKKRFKADDDLTALTNDVFIAYTYDAFYALALAAQSVQGEVTGTLVAGALRRFTSQEKPFSIGPSFVGSFSTAASSLRGGNSVAMRGVTGTLRFTAEGDRDPALFDRWTIKITEEIDPMTKVKTRKVRLESLPFQASMSMSM
jgi:ABC-type branched-subunit amino acid transport system substrate-binding protein